MEKIDAEIQTEKPGIVRNLAYSLGVMALVIATEYFFRHYVLFWLPVVGSYQVNDMISLLLAYLILLAVLGWGLKIDWRDELRGIWQALRDLATQWTYLKWILLMVICLTLLPILDKIVWAKLSIPMLLNPYRNPTVWLGGIAGILKVISLILVNGVFVPIAEEFLWRGQAQVHLLRIFPSGLAIGVTAVLFSFKHVLVDASFGRFLALIAFGVITGVIAAQKSWHNSAALHIFINTVATIAGLFYGVL